MSKIAQEKQFETKVKKFLEAKGCYQVKFFANSFTKVGIPDVLACVNGFFIGIELKAPNGKPSDLQLYNLREIERAGGYGVLLYPENYTLFRNFIDCLLLSDENAKINYDLLKGVRNKWELKKISLTC